MKGLLKNLGLILVVIGAVILVACSFTLIKTQLPE